MDLKDRVAFITGGARGIGKKIADVYAEFGAHIVIGDINEAVLKDAVADLKKYGTEVAGYILDVGDMKSCDEVTKKAIDKFGRIDILVNNAGITRDNLLIRMAEEDFDAVVRINLRGTFNCTKAVARSMMKQRQGRIINIASVIGIVGNAGQVNYAASKAGIIGVTKSVAKELASRNINVNAIAPGYIITEMTEALPEEVKEKMLDSIPLKRGGEPVDVANAALFLASDYSSYITGQVLVVDGGMVM
jgi:3-oxoacyl-[acyl-carrier protein] reductase